MFKLPLMLMRYSVFTSINCKWAGSVHDSRIWRNTNVRATMVNNPAGAILLADDGYAITPWTITPFENAASNAEKTSILYTLENEL